MPINSEVTEAGLPLRDPPHWGVNLHGSHDTLQTPSASLRDEMRADWKNQGLMEGLRILNPVGSGSGEQVSRRPQ